MKKKTHTTDALAILDKRYKLNTPARKKSIQKEQEKADIAEKIYNLRIKAGVSQAQLAKKIGTTQSVISRLEDADYDKHGLPILRNIAQALGQRVELRFVPLSSRIAQAL